VTMKNVVFWDVTPCDSCKIRLHHQGHKNRRTRNVSLTSNRRASSTSHNSDRLLPPVNADLLICRVVVVRNFNTFSPFTEDISRDLCGYRLCASMHIPEFVTSTYHYIYSDVFGRMPLLLGNLKLDTPVVARQPKVKHFHGYAHHSVLSRCMVA
jgi:hypothetical protein